MDTTIHIEYPFFRSFSNLFWLTLFGLLIYYGIGYGLNSEAFQLDSLNVGKFLIYVIVDQYLFECISVAILFGTVLLYVRLLKLDTVTFSAKSLTAYFIKFLPLALIVFFLINPITQTIRFFWRFFGTYDWSVYWKYYFFNPQLYFTYTSILMPLTYLAIVLNLLIQFRDHSKKMAQESTEQEKWETIKIFSDGYENLISSKEALWFEVQERNYFVITSEGRYRIGLSLRELEKVLNDRFFFRINRSAIINLSSVNSFSHWKNGKYIVKMTDKSGSEHTLPRNRVSDFKKKMHDLVS